MRLLYFVVVLGFIFSSCLSDKKIPPNVVFFLVDDLGWKDITCYGSDFYQTPNIDKLAEEGVLFTDAYSACTVCSPSRASIMTGKYPARINCTDWIEGWKFPYAKLNVPEWTMFMDTSEYTMAEMFRYGGYETAHVGKWHLGEKEMYWPENHGFDINIAGWRKGAPNKNKKEGFNGYFSPYGNPRLKDGPDGEYLTERLAHDACQFIEQNKDKPFFLNFWFYNVHTPLQAKKEKVDKYKQLIDTTKLQQNPIYAAMVEHMDEAVGLVITKLKSEGLLHNTIIVFTSDNGGLIGKNYPKTNNYPLQSGKGDIYEGGIRVPAIITIPNAKRRGYVCDEPIISPDFYPTLVELTGLPIPYSAASSMDGRSLVPLLKGDSAFNRDAIFWHYQHYHIEGATPYSAVRKGEFKLIHLHEDNAYELYNIKNDIGETTNLVSVEKSKARELKLLLQSWKEQVEAQMGSDNPDYNPKKWNKR